MTTTENVKIQDDDSEAHLAQVDQFLARLREFLAAPNHCEGDWPEIPVTELARAKELMQGMADLMWARDCDSRSPIRLSVLDRQRHHIVWDLPVRVAPRQDESYEEEEGRLQSNLRMVAGAISAYGQQLALIDQYLYELRRARLARAAAFDVFRIDYVQPADSDPTSDRAVSLHLSKEAALSFEAGGLEVARIVRLEAKPGLQANMANNFAEFRGQVERACGRVMRLRELADLQLRSEIRLRTERPQREG